ncbi:hypothetical protein VTN96DRAFT_2948 [Rasamsonia emersonii]
MTLKQQSSQSARGCLYLGHCGILKGKHVTGPRAMIASLRKKFPEAKWDDTTRVVHDGNLWTSGGVTNGNDLIATYIKETYPAPLAQTVCAVAEIGDKPLKYEIGSSAVPDFSCGSP